MEVGFLTVFQNAVVMSNDKIGYDNMAPNNGMAVSTNEDADLSIHLDNDAPKDPIDCAIENLRKVQESSEEKGGYEALTPSDQASNHSVYALIDKSGICISCEDANATEAQIRCMHCKQNFHAVCRNASGDKKDS